MLKTIFTILSCFVISAAEAGPVVVAVQSVEVPPYNEAFNGFQSVCTTPAQRIVISEFKHGNVTGTITADPPDLVLAIGLDALNTVKAVRDLPIIYMMVLNPDPAHARAPNITGVSMNIPQAKQLAIIAGALPRAKRIGLFYDPDRTGCLVRRNQAAALGHDIRILAQAVKTARRVPVTLDRMTPPDALWMIPDVTVITPETLESLFHYSLDRKIPLITFSEKYLALGAFMSIGLDVFDIGRQAGDMATRVLGGTPVETIPPVEARKAVVTINRTVARKLGIPINENSTDPINVID